METNTSPASPGLDPDALFYAAVNLEAAAQTAFSWLRKVPGQLLAPVEMAVGDVVPTSQLETALSQARAVIDMADKWKRRNSEIIRKARALHQDDAVIIDDSAVIAPAGDGVRVQARVFVEGDWTPAWVWVWPDNPTGEQAAK